MGEHLSCVMYIIPLSIFVCLQTFSSIWVSCGIVLTSPTHVQVIAEHSE